MHRTNRRFWSLTILGVALALLAAGIGRALANSDEGTDVVHFMSNGQSAYFYQYVPGSHYYYVTVTETESSANPGTDTRSVYLYAYWYDYTTVPVTVRQFYGTIPSGDFSAGNGTASLSTNTADMTGYRYPAGAPDIQIDLEWASNGTYSAHQTGQTQTTRRIGDIVYRYVTNGVTDYDYADVEGALGDTEVTMEGSTSAYILQNRNVQHTMSRN